MKEKVTEEQEEEGEWAIPEKKKEGEEESKGGEKDDEFEKIDVGKATMERVREIKKERGKQKDINEDIQPPPPPPPEKNTVGEEGRVISPEITKAKKNGTTEDEVEIVVKEKTAMERAREIEKERGEHKKIKEDKHPLPPPPPVKNPMVGEDGIRTPEIAEVIKKETAEESPLDELMNLLNVGAGAESKEN